MEALAAYVIPVSTLRSGHNELDFKVDWRFFQHFEGSPVQQGSFDIRVLFDKFPDLWHLQFGIHGEMDTECDRCLVPISLPVTGEYEIYVKFDEGQKDAEPDADIIYVSRESTQFDISQFIYEFIVLSMPVAKTYDCQSEQNPPCDKDMLARLRQQETESSVNPLSEILKNIQIDR